MASAGSLVFELAADVSRLRTDMSKAQTEIKGSLDSIAKNTAMSGLKAGYDFAMGFARGFANQIKAAVDQADALGKLSQRIGTTVEQLSALTYAGQFAGVSTDDLTAGFKGMNKALLDARDPLSDSAAAFKALGLNVQELRTMDPGKAFDEIAGAFSKFSDGAQKAAIATQLFGKQGQALIPMLNGGKEGLEAARQEAENLGLIISTKTAMDMSDLNDRFTTLKNLFTGVATQLASALVPAFDDLVDGLKDAKIQGTTMNTVFVAVGKEAARTASDILSLTAETTMFINTVKAWGQIARQVATADFGGAKATYDAMQKANAEGYASLNHRKEYLKQQAEYKFDPGGMAEANAWATVESNARRAGKAYADMTGELDKNAKAHEAARKRTKKEVDEYAQMLEQLSEQLRAAQANGDQMAMLTTDPKYLTFNETQKKTLRDMLALTMDRTAANEALKKSQDDLAKANDDADKSLIASRESARSFAEAELDAIDPTREYVRTLAALDEAQKLIPISAERMAAMQERAAKKMKDATDNLNGTKDQLRDLQQAVEGFGKQSTDALVDFAFSTKDVTVSFSEMITSMLKDLAKLLVYKNVMEPLVKGISGGGATGWLSAFSGLVGGSVPGRMAGGPVSPGQVYEINELPGRREYFIPNTPGKVVTDASMADSGAGPNVAITVNVHKNSEEDKEDTTADSRKAAELGKRISAVVRQVIATEKRTGGLLA